MRTVQRSHKGDHGRLIRNAPEKTDVGKYVYLYCASMTTSTAERLPPEFCGKLLSIKTGLFRAIQVLPMTVTIEQNGACHAVSADHAKIAPVAKKTLTKDNRTLVDETFAERKERNAGETQMEEDNVANVAQSLAVDRIGFQVQKGDSAKYVVRWYG